MALDPVVAKLLDLSSDTTHVFAAAGGGCSAATTWKIETQRDHAAKRLFFMKTGTGLEAEAMFEGLRLDDA